MSPADKAVAALERFHCGDYESAVHLFEQAAEEAPSTEVLNDLGYAQQTCGRIREAERSFREALTIAPDNTQAAINLGALLFNNGKIEAAAYWLERGIASMDAARRAAVRSIINQQEPKPNLANSASHLQAVSRPHHEIQ
jgi:Flp pilus assembly protein TadD